MITTRPWELGTWSRSGYHWILCSTDPRQTLRLLDFAGADYVVVYAWERNCNFVRGLVPDYLRIEKVFGGDQIFLLAPTYLLSESAAEGAGEALEDGTRAR